MSFTREEITCLRPQRPARIATVSAGGQAGQKDRARKYHGNPWVELHGVSPGFFMTLPDEGGSHERLHQRRTRIPESHGRARPGRPVHPNQADTHPSAIPGHG